MKSKVSVVIPNYNGKEYLENCMESLMNQTFKNFEIVLVDDASSDNSAKDIMDKYGNGNGQTDIRYIFHNENKGFAQSVNDGIKASKAEYVILLNNDTIADKKFVYAMLKSILRSDKIFSVSAKMLSMKDKSIMDDGGDYYCLLGWAFSPDKDKKADKCNKRKRIFSACGGAAIYRKKILEEIGMFDSAHFAYLEDVDVGYRAGLYGYINIYEPDAVVIHAGSASSGSRYNAFKAKLTARNNIYLIYKNMPGYQLVINSPWIIVGTLIKLIFYIRKGLGKAYFDGILEGFRLCGKEESKERKTDFEKAGILKCLKMEIFLIFNTITRVTGV